MELRKNYILTYAIIAIDKKALKNGDRKLAGTTAPAQGLYSLKVIYPEGLVRWPSEVIDN